MAHSKTPDFSPIRKNYTYSKSNTKNDNHTRFTFGKTLENIEATNFNKTAKLTNPFSPTSESEKIFSFLLNSSNVEPDKHYLQSTTSSLNKEFYYEIPKRNIAYMPVSKKFNEYLNRVEEHTLKHKKYLEELKNKQQNMEKKKYTAVPKINKNVSKLNRTIIDSSRNSYRESLTNSYRPSLTSNNFLERMKEHQEKAKKKREDLEKKINEEKKRKKEESEKPWESEFTNLGKVDPFWEEKYKAIKEKELQRKKKLDEKLKEKELKEKNSCTFRPEINKNIKNDTKVFDRLYNNDLLQRKQKKKELDKNNTPTFEPALNNKLKKLINDPKIEERKQKNKDKENNKAENAKKTLEAKKEEKRIKKKNGPKDLVFK